MVVVVSMLGNVVVVVVAMVVVVVVVSPATPGAIIPIMLGCTSAITPITVSMPAAAKAISNIRFRLPPPLYSLKTLRLQGQILYCFYQI